MSKQSGYMSMSHELTIANNLWYIELCKDEARVWMFDADNNRCIDGTTCAIGDLPPFVLAVLIMRRVVKAKD